MDVQGITSDGDLYELAAGTRAIIFSAALSYINGTGPTGIVVDSKGDLFVTTATGGPGGSGTFFEIVAGTRAFVDLMDFNGTNGGAPGNLLMDAKGNIFFSAGSIFELSAGTDSVVTLAAFPYPSQLVCDPSGNLFAIVNASFEDLKNSKNGYQPYSKIIEIAAGTTQMTAFYSMDNPSGEPTGDLITDANGDIFATGSGGAKNQEAIPFRQ